MNRLEGMLTGVIVAIGSAAIGRAADAPLKVASLPASYNTAAMSTLAGGPFQNVFHAGEDFTYAIRWGKITGGYSNLSVQNVEQVGGHPTYHLVSEAHSVGLVNSFFPVKDRNEAWLDQQTPRTLRYAKRIREGKYFVDQVVDLDQDSHRYHRHEVRVDRNEVEEQDGAIPPNVLDIFGSLYYIRSLPLEVGQSYTLDVQSGDKTWPLVVNVLKREKVKVKAGKFDCFKVEPVLRGAGMFISKGKKMEVWITADARRIPVLMRSEIFIGHVSAELVREKLAGPESVTLSSTPKSGIQDIGQD